MQIPRLWSHDTGTNIEKIKRSEIKRIKSRKECVFLKAQNRRKENTKEEKEERRSAQSSSVVLRRRVKSSRSCWTSQCRMANRFGREIRRLKTRSNSKRPATSAHANVYCTLNSKHNRYFAPQTAGARRRLPAAYVLSVCKCFSVNKAYQPVRKGGLSLTGQSQSTDGECLLKNFMLTWTLRLPLSCDSLVLMHSHSVCVCCNIICKYFACWNFFDSLVNKVYRSLRLLLYYNKSNIICLFKKTILSAIWLPSNLMYF